MDTKQGLSLMVAIGLLALAYYLSARWSLLLSFEGTNASPVWPPSGLALGAVLLLGRRAWPAILLGDFNATASSLVYRTLTRGLEPARRLARRKQPTTTFPSPLPVLRIDHLFVSPEIKVSEVFAPFEPLTRLASDHLPLVMDFELV